MKSFEKAFTAIVLSAAFSMLTFMSVAQRSDRAITLQEQKQIIEKAFVLLKANYIFPNIIPAMEKEVNKKFSAGAYSKFLTAEDFLKNINVDLEQLSNDRHIDIFYDPIRVKQINAESKNENEKPAYAPEFLQRAKYENFLVKKAERLDGNVGYLKFNSFVDTTLSKNTLVAAMNFLANSNALIIDLRQNGGGDARTVAFLLSYFLPDSTLISTRRSRTTSLTSQYVAGDPIVNKFTDNIPLYILVSKRTSSAAEAFAYTLQSYKRATIVGEVTNGEANPGYLFPINDEMYIMIPAFENINPVTNTNWQAKGVIPDIPVPADQTLTMAQAKAYERMAQVIPVKELKSMYNWMAAGLFAELQPVTVKAGDLQLLAGEYADTRHVIFNEGTLFYYRGDNAAGKKKLVPMAMDLFSLEGVPFFRIRFIKNDKGAVTALEGIYDDGKTEVSKKI